MNDNWMKWQIHKQNLRIFFYLNKVEKIILYKTPSTDGVLFVARRRIELLLPG